MYLPTKGTLKKRSEKDLFDDVYAIFLDFLYKTYGVGTHLNCIEKSMPFKYAFIDKKYTDCNLKTTELLVRL